MITWCSSTTTARWPSTTTPYVWLPASRVLDPRAALVGVCTRDGHSPPPPPIPSRLPHQHGLKCTREHWVAAFLEESKCTEYWFWWDCAFGVHKPMFVGDGLPGNTLQHKMLQGPFSKSCRLMPCIAILLIGPLGTNFSEILIKLIHLNSIKYIWKYRLGKVDHFVSASMCLTNLWC